MNTIIENYKNYWKEIFNIKGRATRSEYWHVILVNMIISLTYSIFVSLISFLFPNPVAFASMSNSALSMFSVICLIPSFTLLVRRLHDVGKPTWVAICFYVINLITTTILMLFIVGLAIIGLVDAFSTEMQLPSIVYIFVAIILIVVLIISLLNTVVMLVFLCKDSVPDNKWGPNKKTMNYKNYSNIDNTNNPYTNTYENQNNENKIILDSSKDLEI